MSDAPVLPSLTRAPIEELADAGRGVGTTRATRGVRALHAIREVSHNALGHGFNHPTVVVVAGPAARDQHGDHLAGAPLGRVPVHLELDGVFYRASLAQILEVLAGDPSAVMRLGGDTDAYELLSRFKLELEDELEFGHILMSDTLEELIEAVVGRWGAVAPYVVGEWMRGFAFSVIDDGLDTLYEACFGIPGMCAAVLDAVVLAEAEGRARVSVTGLDHPLARELRKAAGLSGFPVSSFMRVWQTESKGNVGVCGPLGAADAWGVRAAALQILAGTTVQFDMLEAGSGLSVLEWLAPALTRGWYVDSCGLRGHAARPTGDIRNRLVENHDIEMPELLAAAIALFARGTHKMDDEDDELIKHCFADETPWSAPLSEDDAGLCFVAIVFALRESGRRDAPRWGHSLLGLLARFVEWRRVPAIPDWAWAELLAPSRFSMALSQDPTLLRGARLALDFETVRALPDSGERSEFHRALLHAWPGADPEGEYDAKGTGKRRAGAGDAARAPKRHREAAPGVAAMQCD